MSCRFCRSGSGETVLDLGHQPGSELFPRVADPGPDATFPLRMWLCADCGLAQLVGDVDVPEEPTGDEPAALRAQRGDAVAWLVDTGLLPAGGTVAEFPSPHGGTWLELLSEHGLTRAAPGRPADVVVDGCFGIMHEPDQLAALRERAAALAPGGVLLVQYHGLDAILAHAQWNSLRLGHYAYYSTPALVGMLATVGLTVTAARRFALYGGTVLLTASAAPVEVGPSVAAVTDLEVSTGVLRAEAVAGLQASVRRTCDGLRELLQTEAARGHRVLGYGAASRAVSLLCLAGIDSTLLAGVADASADKQGRRMPGTDIPVISPAALVAEAPDVVLVFVDDLLDEVRRDLPEIEAAGGRWVTAGSGR